MVTRKISVVGNGVVTVRKNGTLIGTATESQPFSYSAVIGDTVIREAIADIRYYMVKWCTLQNICDVDIIQTSVFTATSTPNQEYVYYFDVATPPPQTKVNVTAISAGNGQVMAYNDPTRVGNSYSLLLDPGAPWTFTALPAQGYQFEKWTDSAGAIATTTTITGIATTDMAFTASFIPGAQAQEFGIAKMFMIVGGTLLLKEIIGGK